MASVCLGFHGFLVPLSQAIGCPLPTVTARQQSREPSECNDPRSLPKISGVITTSGRKAAASSKQKGNKKRTTMNEKTLYVLVQWPESQMLMDNPRFHECLFVNYLEGHDDPGSSAFMCPKDLYDEIF